MKKKLLCVIIVISAILPSFVFGSSAAGFSGNSVTAYAKGADFEEYLVSEMFDFNKSIDVAEYVKKNKWDIDETTQQMEHVILNNPQLFFVETDFTLRYTTTYSYFIIDVSYSISKAQYKSAKVRFDSTVELAISDITDSMTDVQKALAVHDYLAVNTIYDSSMSKFSAYDCLVEKTAVCQGYSLAFSYIMNLLGIECTVIKSDPMNHAWNYIKIDGEYYHVDVTFDDPTFEVNGKTYDTLGKVTHTYFLLSDSAIKKAKIKHYSWKLYDGLGNATDKSYDNSFWRGVETQMFASGLYIYYAVVDNESPGMLEKPVNNKISTLFRRYNVNTGAFRTLCTISSTWNVWGKNSYYKNSFVRLSYYDGCFYFNTSNRVYSVSPSGKNAKIVCRPSTTAGYIYGMTVTDKGKLKIALSPSPLSKPTVKSKQL